MARSADSGQPSARTPREDGRATRQKIIEVAGALFAQQGYVETSAKQITERAGTNAAAVNYHFGGREQLFLAVIDELDRRLIGLDVLAELQATSLSGVDQLAQIIETIIGAISDPEGWPVTLWAREILSPSPLFVPMLRDGVAPKIDILADIVSEITGITDDRTALLQCIVNSLAPCILLASVNRDSTPIRQLYQLSPQQLSHNITEFALAGLHAFADAYRPDGSGQSPKQTDSANKSPAPPPNK
jgi:TetR/AcrR family transcriptional regulator, regulator of cefoperazone and chloramphenicol sensitivity